MSVFLIKNVIFLFDKIFNLDNFWFGMLGEIPPPKQETHNLRQPLKNKN